MCHLLMWVQYESLQWPEVGVKWLYIGGSRGQSDGFLRSNDSIETLFTTCININFTPAWNHQRGCSTNCSAKQVTTQETNNMHARTFFASSCIWCMEIVLVLLDFDCCLFLFYESFQHFDILLPRCLLCRLSYISLCHFMQCGCLSLKQDTT